MRQTDGTFSIRVVAHCAVSLLFVGLASGVVAGCGGEPLFEISEVRERAQPERSAPRGVTSSDRFGSGMQGHGLPQDVGGGHGGAAPARFTWHAPVGWTELPPRPMREVGFRVGTDAECVLSTLTGDGGGLMANVNRWRAQMGQDPIAADAVANLPRTTFLGGPAYVVEVAGTYLGMGDANLEDARLLGLIAERQGSVVFLKLTGPSEVVREQRQPMFVFASSVREQAPAAAGTAGSGLGWTAPESWVLQPERMMREVTYAPGGQAGVECYVAILAGAAGGVEANLNRWRDQMGQPPLPATEIGALRRVPALGRDGVLIEVEGSFTGMEGATHAGSMLLGFIVERDLDTVFVKLTGPADVVRAERARFESFCRSLEQKE